MTMQRIKGTHETFGLPAGAVFNLLPANPNSVARASASDSSIGGPWIANGTGRFIGPFTKFVEIAVEVPVGVAYIGLSVGGGLVVPGSATGCGDSLMAFADQAGALTQTAAGILAAAGGKTSCSVIGWTDAWLGGNRLTLFANRGVGSTTIDVNANSLIGTTTPQFGNGAAAGVLSDSSAGAWIHTGTNHLSFTIDNTSPSVATIIQKFRRLIGNASRRKKWTVVEGIYPIGLGSAVVHYARRFDIPLINAGVAAICAQYPNVFYLDPSVLSIDGGATGDPKFYIADRLHLNTLGVWTLTQTYPAQLHGLLTFTPAYRPVKSIAMPEMAGTSGVAAPGSGTIVNQTGGVVVLPGNIRLTITSGSPVVRAWVLNNRLYFAIDNSASGTACTVVVGLNSATAYMGNLAVGDNVMAGLTLGVTNPIGLKCHDLILTQNYSETAVAISAMCQSYQETNGGGVVFPTTSYGPIALTTQPFTLNAALTSINMQLSTILAAGGSCTFDTGDWVLDAVTPA